MPKIKIIDEFVKKMNVKRAAKCWIDARKQSQNLIQYQMITQIYNQIGKTMLDRFTILRNETVGILQLARRRIRPGTTAGRFVRNSINFFK
jgi:hypothetical protein